MLGFLAKLGLKKAEQVADSFVGKVVAADYDTASEVDLDMMEKDIDGAMAELVEARREYQREQKEADEILARKDELLKAAEYLQTQLAADEEGSETYNEHMEGLNEIVTLLEELKPEIEREVEEAKLAKTFMENLEAFVEEQVAQFKQTKQNLNATKTKMKNAGIREKRAEQMAAKQAALEGRAKKRNNLTVAMDAMNKKAQASEDKVSALEIKNKLMAPPKKKTSSAAQKAMEHVSGTGGSKSVLDRLNDLK